MSRSDTGQIVLGAVAVLLAALAATGAVEQNTMDHELGAAWRVDSSAHSVNVQGAQVFNPAVAPSPTRDCLKIRIRDGKAEFLRFQMRQINYRGFVVLDCEYQAARKTKP